MAEWQHKEMWYETPHCYENVDGIEKNDRNPEQITMEFPEWLDMQCRGGWKLFTIRDYQGKDFCLFRRLV